MTGFLRGTLWAALLLAAFAGCGHDDDDPTNIPTPTVVVDPVPLPGPYAVACTNISQDFGRVGIGEEARDYWEGQVADNGTARYVTDLLADPANTLTATVTAPNDPDLFGSFAGQTQSFVVLVCYPTTDNNPRPDYPYALPDNLVVPHMQTGAEAPIFEDPAARYPVVAFSHGYTGSPISGEYILGITTLASYGYVMIAPFHGDLRFSDLRIEQLEDAANILLNLENFTAMQALRPLSISAALDLLLSHPQWQGHIDNTQIGGFGASLGGETMLLLGGARLTNDYPELSYKQVTLDPRIKAAVGYVPYFGQTDPIGLIDIPAFGRDHDGLQEVTLPFLGIAGTADLTAPLAMTEEGMGRLAGTRELVALAGVEHDFDFPSTGDIFTWTLTFLDAELRRDPAAKEKLSTMRSVAGGGDDSVLIPYNGLP